MAPVVDYVGKISADVEVARLRARVIKIWTVPMFSNPSNLGSIEMVLLDQTMGKIQFTIQKPFINKFIGQVSEGETYAFSHLNVVPNLGTYRATDHQFKVVFTFNTLVNPCVMPSIPLYGISVIPFNKILESNNEFDYLIDVVGLVTSVGSVKEYEREGKSAKMVVCELTTENLKLELTVW